MVKQFSQLKCLVLEYVVDAVQFFREIVYESEDYPSTTRHWPQLLQMEIHSPMKPPGRNVDVGIMTEFYDTMRRSLNHFTQIETLDVDIDPITGLSQNLQLRRNMAPDFRQRLHDRLGLNLGPEIQTASMMFSGGSKLLDEAQEQWKTTAHQLWGRKLMLFETSWDGYGHGRISYYHQVAQPLSDKELLVTIEPVLVHSKD